MHYTRLLIIAAATIFVLALGAFAVVKREANQPGGDPIIIKGGSLTIECPKNDVAGEQCIPFDTTTKKYGHKDKNRKVMKIVVKDSSDAILFDSTDPSHGGGAALGTTPSIEIYYKK